MKTREIPVYMFTGFLESGKTAFIQGTLEDERFNTGEKTLLLVCEEGEEEYNPSEFYGQNVHIKVIEDKSEMTEENLDIWAKHIHAERVLVEYNGMWLLNEFFEAMPEGWAVYQVIFIADSTTFTAYNANMRSLVVDKLNLCELVDFNRFTKDMDKMEFHKIVRGISRRTEIVYDYTDGNSEFDDIEDPLPFDVNADVITVNDKDFALLYRDIMDNMKQYNGKVVKFKGICAVNKKLPEDTFICGRHIMTCCVEDITYCGLIVKWDNSRSINNADWKWLTARIDIRFSKIYGRKGPVLTALNVEPAMAPEETVATFY
ncbi:MAG: GTPase [Clostridiales bacterium]|nr:GTPase [Clostridiales bacterium]